MKRSTIKRYFKLFISLLFAASLSQMPHYMELYLHVLKGALLEAEKNVNALEKRAAHSRKSLMEYIRKHINSKDDDFKNTGRAMLLQIKRYKAYKKAIDSMDMAPLWERPFVFIKNFDYSIAMVIDFKPVLPINREGLVYFLAGFLIGFILIPPMFKF